MKHETKIIYTWIEGDPDSHRCFASCLGRDCTWQGPRRQSALVARIDGKQHRLDTAVEDDRNQRKGAPIPMSAELMADQNPLQARPESIDWNQRKAKR
jgi:hypothetical protein